MKTPKEKAEELVEKYQNYVSEKDFFGDDRSKENAIQCAKIAVDEITKEVEEMISISNYWRDVKEELDKL